MTTEILIADDHAIFRKGLKQLMSDEFPDAIIVEVQTGQELLQKVREKKWSIVISDLSMPGINGMDMIKQVKSEYPRLPLLILSMHSESQYAMRVLKAGASGYITKESASGELTKAIRLILAGRKYVSASFAETLAENLGNISLGSLHESLSDREFEVMKLISSGKTANEIADLLSISVPTVRTYRMRVLEKMKLKNNAELTHYAVTNGLV